MNCQEAQQLVSVLYDGERVPSDCADHVNTCPNCRKRLHNYSQIGAELRLLASRTPAAVAVPPALLRKVGSGRLKFGFAKGSILVPRFAVGIVAGLFLVLTASLMRLHAQQSRPFWFQFELDAQAQNRSDKSFQPQHAVRAGYDDVFVWGDRQNNVVGTHIVVSAIKEDSAVELALRSRRYNATNADQIDVKRDLGDLNGHRFTYIPGRPLQIPIEGGGTLVLRGHVVDHQPKLMASGIPLEPDPDQLILSSPVLISGNTVLSNLKGATAIASEEDQETVIYVPRAGLFRFALRPFPGAIQGQASWGNLDFLLDGRSYSLLTASPICGGDQPRTVWVRNDARFSPFDERLKGGFLSADKLSAPSW